LIELKAYLEKFIPLEDQELQALSRLFSQKKLSKGAYFSVEGRVETNIGFLLKGVIRAFYRNNEGIEYNKTFFTANEFFGAYASLVSGMPNKIIIQALTDCDILMANYDKIKELFSPYRKIETVARRIAEHFYIEKEKREIQLVMLQADARHKIFKEEYPDIENLIPQYHIASYLGITPTQLSRIRAKKV
jgi:CRP-like cAMP-binding protein